MTRVKAIYRSWAIPCTGKQVYARRHRAEWLGKISELGVRQRSEFYYQQLDALRSLRQEVRRELLAESKKQGLEMALPDSADPSDPGGGVAGHPANSAPLPHQATTVDLQWLVHSSADHQVVTGQLQRKKKHIEIRGLNENCNHDLKNLFKGAAIVASTKPGPFAEFYAALLNKGMWPETARLTLARKIATIVLIVWKRSVLRRQSSETTNSLSVLIESAPSWGIFSGGGVGFSGHSGPRASLSWQVRRCVPRASSLTGDPRLSRITRKSDGPRVPDRTGRHLSAFCFGFGADRLRCQEAMKAAGGTSHRLAKMSGNRAHGAVAQKTHPAHSRGL